MSKDAYAPYIRSYRNSFSAVAQFLYVVTRSNESENPSTRYLIRKVLLLDSDTKSVSSD
ncbi:17910_t:CDS:2 [Racocetra persica]|uniref:17910_t:CDS:1 n=1 Tax=Racocetra persica TaxID=160502 RepID=A0ACA9Q3Q1_9GLOM|nr:17910_t:CDS:2 [Racocetra persica]